MTLVKFHKFLTNYSKVKDSVKTEIYVNPETISWFEEVRDNNRWHCTLYVGNEDFIEILENTEEVLCILGCSSKNTSGCSKDNNKTEKENTVSTATEIDKENKNTIETVGVKKERKKTTRKKKTKEIKVEDRKESGNNEQ